MTEVEKLKATFGDYCMEGPRTLIATTGHPMDPKGRRDCLAISKPITVGDDVWIGGNCTIVGGVTIGSNVVVAGGAAVTKDVPDSESAIAWKRGSTSLPVRDCFRYGYSSITSRMRLPSPFRKSKRSYR